MHDAGMLALSNLYDELKNFAFSPTGAEMCLYGDPAYLLRIYLQVSYYQGHLPQQMEDYNKAMSAA